MMLSDAERERFIVYLELDAQSNEDMATQMEALPGIPAVMVRKLKSEAAAARIVAARLRAVESQTLKSESR